MKVGVLAIQGDFERHIESLMLSGVDPKDIVEVRTDLDLAQADGLIIPGGESSTVGQLMERVWTCKRSS